MSTSLQKCLRSFVSGVLVLFGRWLSGPVLTLVVNSSTTFIGTPGRLLLQNQKAKMLVIPWILDLSLLLWIQVDNIIVMMETCIHVRLLAYTYVCWEKKITSQPNTGWFTCTLTLPFQWRSPIARSSFPNPDPFLVLATGRQELYPLCSHWIFFKSIDHTVIGGSHVYWLQTERRSLPSNKKQVTTMNNSSNAYFADTLE